MIPLQGLKAPQTTSRESHPNPGSAERANCCSESMLLGPTVSQCRQRCMLQYFDFEGPLRPGSLCELAYSNLAGWHFANPNMSYYMSASSKLCRSWPVRRAPHSAVEGSLVGGAPSKLECWYTSFGCPLSGKRSRRAAASRRATWPRRM